MIVGRSWLQILHETENISVDHSPQLGTVKNNNIYSQAYTTAEPHVLGTSRAGFRREIFQSHIIRVYNIMLCNI